MFVTVRPNIVEAEWAAEEEKDEKKKKKNQKKKTSAETIRHLVLRTGCLNRTRHIKQERHTVASTIALRLLLSSLYTVVPAI